MSEEAYDPQSEASRARLAVVESLCEHLSDGLHADQWYGKNGNPSHQTIWRWRRAYKPYDDAIEDARRTGSHVLIDQAVAIADGSHPVAQGPEAYPGQRKTQCWARFEAAKRINPARYGDKMALGGDASAPAIKVESAQGPAAPQTAAELRTWAAKLAAMTGDAPTSSD